MLYLVYTVGLPGSGKTTWAMKFIEGREGAWSRVNRDLIRAMLHNSVYKEALTENLVYEGQEALILSLLRNGSSVVCDDTNLSPSSLQRFARLISDLKPQIVGLRMKSFLDVPLETCLERNRLRDGVQRVSESVIRDMFEGVKKNVLELAKNNRMIGMDGEEYF